MGVGSWELGLRARDGFRRIAAGYARLVQLLAEGTSAHCIRNLKVQSRQGVGRSNKVPNYSLNPSPDLDLFY
jgi:hypothetical protein